MGDHTLTTAQKCIFGVFDAIARGKKPGPSVQENCEVAQREAKDRAEQTKQEKRAEEPKKKPAKKKLKKGSASHALEKYFQDVPPEKFRELLKKEGETIYFLEKHLPDKNPKFKITPPKSLLEKLHSLKKYEEILKLLPSDPNLLRRQELEVIEKLLSERKKLLQTR